MSKSSVAIVFVYALTVGCAGDDIGAVTQPTDAASTEAGGDAGTAGDMGVGRDAAGRDSNLTEAPGGLGRGLVAYWRFDEGEGVVVGDSSGNGNRAEWLNGGIVQGGMVESASRPPSGAWAPGAQGAAGDFLGDQNWVAARASLSLDSVLEGGGLSVSAWVRLDSLDFTSGLGYAAIVQRHELGTRFEHFGLLLSEGAPLGTIHNTSSVSGALAAKPLPIGQWVHLAMTYDGSDIRVYQNGALVASRAVVHGFLPPQGTPTTIGAGINEEDVIEIFPGRIDEVRLYRRALSPPEIATLATIGQPQL